MGAGPKRNLKLRYSLMTAAVAVVIAGWSGGWLYLREKLDRRIAAELSANNDSGNEITCNDREIAGFPFRFEVTCNQPVATTASGISISLKRLRAIALVYNPWHLIFEAESPAVAEIPFNGDIFSATWTSARSSLRVSEDSPRKIDVAIEDLDFTSSGLDTGGFLAKTVEFHARPVPETPNSIEGFVSADALQVEQADGLAAPLNARLHLRLENGLGLFSNNSLSALPHDDDGSLPFELVWMSLMSDETEIAASGKLRLADNGTLSGKIDLKIAGIENAEDLLTRLFPMETGIPATLQGTAIAFGVRKDDSDGTSATHLPLTIDNGALRVGIIPLGITIPPFTANTF